MPIFAAYLYDAVRLYAKAVNDTLRDGGHIKNGSDIISKIRSSTYRSEFITRDCQRCLASSIMTSKAGQNWFSGWERAVIPQIMNCIKDVFFPPEITVVGP